MSGTEGVGPGDASSGEAVKQFRTFLPYIVFGVLIESIAYGFGPRELILKYAGPDNPFASPCSDRVLRDNDPLL
jgi:hypothetical protein